MTPKLSIIIPIYNEEECITPLYEELHEVLTKFGRSYEILFVDDGSKDRSFSILKGIHDHDSCVRIIKFRSNFGQSAAMKAGFDHAEGEIIVTMDGDLQNDPHDIPTMIDYLIQGNYDVVCGWRKNRHDPWLKRKISRIANRFRAWMNGETIHDSGCTLRVYIRDSIQNLELYGELHRYIPAILLWRGYYIGEIITNHRDRTLGKSKYNWKRLTKGFLDLLVVSFWQKYSARPMHIFGGTGLVLGMIGFFLLLGLVYERVFFSISLWNRSMFQISILLIIVGTQFFAFGILADILMKIYHNQNEKVYLIEKFF
ncbi:glycosyltransferase [Methanospirillum sp. J.3.6.1-F.2.7.3]|uniref:Glycosyltransferase n=1 Tax=Methanospirillum purgamenti TaxID=2834276 RepID=A0A8E7B1M8_9EURY|nr:MULTISPECIES: glycosyltransferase family 2 protein [Methanospirillum]MDX8549504.1 glycosyltransferase [Methanospirillum hungatei]QVV89214.1 glycosyltransferase [Methanospirillum sp. J.3.6.1-F.2.7.3]